MAASPSETPISPLTPVWPETTHDYPAAQSFLISYEKWFYLSSAIYAIAVLGGQRLMVNRVAFNLRSPLAAWSFTLALFSTIAFIRVLPGSIEMLRFRFFLENPPAASSQFESRRFGFSGTVCSSVAFDDTILSFWGYIFVLSKVPEYIDTLFVVLRKQKVIFLHWYHHATVVLVVVETYPTKHGMALLFMVMNYGVHSLMYSYFCLRALRIRVPKPAQVFVTTCQIVQMIIATAAGIVGISMVYRGTCVDQHFMAATQITYHASLITTSYFILFVHFFIDNYVVKDYVQKACNFFCSSSKCLKTVENGKSNGVKQE